MNLNINWIFQQLMNSLQSWVQTQLLNLCSALIGLVNSGTSGFWNQPLIQCFLQFSKWVNIVVFTVATLFMLFDMAEEFASSKEVDFSVVFTNALKAMLFVEFNSLLAQLSMDLGDILTSSLHFTITAQPNTILQILNGLSVGAAAILWTSLMLVVILIAVIVFFFMSVARYGAMFLLILSSSLYIPDILRGDTTSLGSWLRQMVAIAGTYIFQYICFYGGLYYLLQSNIVMCAILWTGMFSASKILQKFGYSTGTKGVLSTAGSLAGQGISLLSKV